MTDPVPTVLVTGATSGLGRALVQELTADGRRVLAHGRDRARTEALADAVGAVPVVADLADLAQVDDLAEQVLGATDRLDVLVNNAGVGFGAPGSGREVSADGHELRLAVNYLAPVALTRALLPLVTSSAPSRIVNVGSMGQMPVDLDDIEFERDYDGTDAYRRAKLALAAWTFDLAEELAGSGVSVTCLHPATFMDTTMVRDSGVTPTSTVTDGLRATRRLVDDPDLEGVTGEFFNGTQIARARPQAYDPEFRKGLRELTNRLLQS